MKKNQTGFSAIEGLIVVVVVVAVGVLGYYVYQHNYKTKAGVVTVKASKTNNPAYLGYKSPTTSTQVPPTITSASSLTTAYNVLNQTSVSSNNVDSAQLSSQASNF
jgi:Tfp pilus assembly protein PilV